MTALRLAAAALVAAFAVLVPVPAWAHAQLLASDPDDGARLPEAVDRVVLEFSETLDPASTVIAVVLPDGDGLVLDDPVFDGATVTQPVTLPVTGEYTVSYRIVSVDGHPVEGAITFTVDSVAPGNADAPRSPAPGSSADAPDSDGPPWTWIGVGAAVLAVVVAAAVLLWPRSRSLSMMESMRSSPGELSEVGTVPGDPARTVEGSP